MTRSLSILFCLSLGFTCLQAQLGLGFKAGLSYMELDGPLERTADEVLEEYTLSSGFQIGVVFDYAFTDLVGLRAELLFSQKGGRYKYDGDGYFFISPANLVVARGDKLIQLDIVNTYIDIPITAYYKVGKFEIHGGAVLGLLVGSKARGIRQFNGTVVGSGEIIERFEQTLDYNYGSDRAQGFLSGDAIRLMSGAVLPKSPGAYFDFPPLTSRVIAQPTLYQRFELGLVGGLTFFPNKGLGFTARYHLGLSDVTNEEADISQIELTGSSGLVRRDDDDKNRGFQFSIMFLF